jgi:uncharacterized protein YciI
MEKKIFVVVLRYLVDIETINAARASHLEFLKQHYDTGVFFCSGRQNSGNGGVILAHSENRKILLDILHQDPFYTKNLAEFQVFDFTPHNVSKNFSQFMETLRPLPNKR